LAIHEDPELVYKYTGKGNLVAVVTNGTAVLGLGNIGPSAGKPVMEGKAVLFKRFADIDVFDIELAASRPEDVIRACQMMEPTFGGINLEDIKAPECFVIEEALKKSLQIPVFHDDQHGTAIIAGAALVNGLELAGKAIGAARVVINGAGAAAVACAKHFIRLGIAEANILMCDTKGVLYEGRVEGLNPYKAQFMRRTDARTLEDALREADVFLGLSQANSVTGGMLKKMAARPLILALANPDPEIPYPDAIAARPDAIVATGRSDYPNQVNNILGFPAIFRGALDSRATCVNEQMMMAATKSLAALAKENVPDSVCAIYGSEDLRFGPRYIIPKPFDPRVVLQEAPAVVQAAIDSGVARNRLDIKEYRSSLERRLGVGSGVTRLLIQKARHKPCRVVFPEGENRTVLRACRTLLDEGIATPSLLGNRKVIEEIAAEVHLDLSKVEIADIAGHPRHSYYAEELHRIRQRKGITRNEAAHLLRDANVFAALMLRLNDADALVTGLTTHYSDSVRPLLQIIPLRPGVRRASGLYLVLAGTRSKLYFLADCTVNINPSAEDLAEIALCAAETARRFDVEPRVAFLSFSNFGSSRHESSERVRRAVEIVRGRSHDLIVDGEMQADTAVLPERLESTYPFSGLKGGANVLVFPNLDSGNIAYKLLGALGGAQVIGPILMGPSKPVHVLQRDASVADVVNLAALAAVEAGELSHSVKGSESRLMRQLLSRNSGHSERTEKHGE